MSRPVSVLLASVLSIGLAAVASAQQIAFQPQAPVKLAEAPEFLALADFDVDGFPDVVASSPAARKVTILLSDGSGGVRAVVAAGPVGGSMRRVVGADLDDDGIPDVGVTDPARNQILVFKGVGDGMLESPVIFASGRDPFGIAVGEFDGFLGNDLTVSNAVDDNVSVFFNRGTGRPAFAPRINFGVGNRPEQVLVQDFNFDGIDDIIALNVGSSGADDVTVLIGNGDGGFQSRGNFVVGQSARHMTFGDFDNDGVNDLAVVNGRATSQQTLISGFTVLLNDGFGFLNRSEFELVDCGLISATTVCIPNGIAAGDFDLDGNVDLAVLVSRSKNIFIYAGNGDGTFDLVGALLDVDTGVAVTTHFLLADDFDQDGLIDLVASGGNNVVYFHNDTEFPAFPTATGTPGTPGSGTATPGSGTATPTHTIPGGGGGTPVATSTPTPTGTRSPTANVTPSKQRGDTCGFPEECVTGFCIDGRCCDTACTGANQSCDLNPPGICQTNPTPGITPGSGEGSVVVGRSGGCSVGDAGGSAAPVAILLLPAALWVGRRRVFARVAGWAHGRSR